jgi:hypothetical protein
MLVLSLTLMAHASDTLTGTVYLDVVDDFTSDGLPSEAAPQLVLRTDSGEPVALGDPDGVLADLGCARVEVSGAADKSGVFRVETAACVDGGEEPTGYEPDAVTTTRDALVIRINMTDSSVGPSEAYLDAMLFGPSASVDEFFALSTFGGERLQGDVVSVAIPFSASTCNVFERFDWASAAEAQAAIMGFPASAYDRIIYVLPDASVCPWAGIATQGGKWSWIRDNTDPHVYAHELGHNRGLGHANGLWECVAYPYFDRSDAMGLDYIRFNAPHLEQAGWLDPSDVVEVTTSGTYTLEALHRTADGVPPRALKIWDPSAGANVYLSLREPVGDYEAPMTPDIASKISVHRFLDPMTTLSDRPTLLVDALSVGQDYWFADGTVRVRFLADFGSTADVQITVHPCYMAVPVCHAPPPPPTGCGGTN